MMAARETFVCAPCRVVSRSNRHSMWWSFGHNMHNPGSVTCPQCRQPMKCMGLNWRPPKRHDDAAWKRIQRGDFLTERNPRERERGFARPFRWVKGRRVALDVREPKK